MNANAKVWGAFSALKRNLFKGDLHQLSMGEELLSEDDSRRVCDAYLRLFLLAYDIGQEIQGSYLDPESRLVFSRNCSTSALFTRIMDFAHHDTAVIFKQFKCTLQALRHLSDNGRPQWKNQGGRKYCSKKLNHYVKTYDVDVEGPVWRFIQPYFFCLWVIDTPDMFRFCNDLVQYIQRLTLQDVTWIEDENIQEYIDFEENLKTLEYDPDIVADLRQIITDWFKDFSFESRWVDHGYGATAEVKRSEGTAAKYRKMVPTVETALLADLMDWRPATNVAWIGLTRSYEQMLEDYRCHSEERLRYASDMVCKVQLVPKGCDKKRVVSKEPTNHQFYQKMIGSAMSDHFDRHPEMHIHLHDQSLNRCFALLGSAWRNYATIDLSSASDSNTLTLFKGLFRDTPVYDPILWCRTTKAELPDGRIVVLEKMCPMGSATCFPLECTVFSAIVALANKRLGVHTNYFVYGDDIVVEARIYDEVVKLLKELHFLVNEDKSFPPEAPFKESCGIECYYGVDVSPIRLSRKFDSVAMKRDKNILWNTDYLVTSRTQRSRVSARSARTEGSDDKVSLQLDSWYKHANDAFLRGYMTLRYLYISEALDVYKCVAFAHNSKGGFLTLSTNICLPNVKERYYSDYLYDERRKGLYVRVLATKSDIAEGPSKARYSKLLEEYDRTSREQLSLPEDRIEAFAGAARSYYNWEWVLKQTLDDYS